MGEINHEEKGTDKTVICQDKTIEPVIRTFQSGWAASRLSKTRLKSSSCLPRAPGDGRGGAAIARQLNGPLTALLLYMNEIKQHSHQFSQTPGNRVYLQQVVENALQQTERVCAMVKQMSDNHPAPDPDNKSGTGEEGRPQQGR